jgi:hypothetical protein
MMIRQPQRPQTVGFPQPHQVSSVQRRIARVWPKIQENEGLKDKFDGLYHSALPPGSACEIQALGLKAKFMLAELGFEELVQQWSVSDVRAWVSYMGGTITRTPGGRYKATSKIGYLLDDRLNDPLIVPMIAKEVTGFLLENMKVGDRFSVAAVYESFRQSYRLFPELYGNKCLGRYVDRKRFRRTTVRHNGVQVAGIERVG